MRAGDLDHPDELRVDLDPGPGVAWADVRAVALEVQGAARRARAARLAEDERLARHARQRAHRAALDVHRGAARGAGAVARDRAARAHARDVEVVEGGAPRRLPRLQPERQGPHDLLGVLGAAAAGCARVDAARLERGARLRAGAISRCSPCPRASPRVGDPHAAMDAAAGSLEALLELAARDEASGLGDAPWPPHFRKMEGEAPRVAPSAQRAKGAPSARDGDGAAEPGRGRRRRARRMPLIVVANSPNKEAALAGLERWKARHRRGRRAARRRRRAGRLDARPLVDVDAHAREPAPRAGDARPPPETPDPDDDPTREWRRGACSDPRARPERRAARRDGAQERRLERRHRSLRRRIAASSCGGTTSSCAYVQSRGGLSVRQRRNCAVWRKRAPCM